MSRREGPDVRQPERWQARMAERTAPRLTARRGWMISRYSSTKPARIMDDARLAPASQGSGLVREGSRRPRRAWWRTRLLVSHPRFRRGRSRSRELPGFAQRWAKGSQVVVELVPIQKGAQLADLVVGEAVDLLADDAPVTLGVGWRDVSVERHHHLVDQLPSHLSTEPSRSRSESRAGSAGYASPRRSHWLVLRAPAEPSLLHLPSHELPHESTSSAGVGSSSIFTTSLYAKLANEPGGAVSIFAGVCDNARSMERFG